MVQVELGFAKQEEHARLKLFGHFHVYEQEKAVSGFRVLVVSNEQPALFEVGVCGLLFVGEFGYDGIEKLKSLLDFPRLKETRRFFDSHIR